MKNEFLLDPNIVYLNHGSYGATPRRILQHQRAWQDRMEREPVKFMSKILPAELHKAREVAAEFLHVSTDSISCITNATYGVHTIISQRILPGMTVVCTSHRYPAVYNALQYICDKKQAKLIQIEIPFGELSPAQLLEHIWESIPSSMDFILLDEISSSTAIRFPIHKLCKRIKQHYPNTEILIDGAHSPGQIESDFAFIDYWTGNLHKWCCAPKGCALLYVHPEKQRDLHAPVISHGYREGFQEEMAWMGTHDPAAFLCIPEVLQQYNSWGGKELRQQHHDLMLRARAAIMKAFPYFVVDESVHGLAICAFLIPYRENLYETLVDTYSIETLINPYGEKLLLRISCFSVYNRVEDYRILIKALKSLGY